MLKPQEISASIVRLGGWGTSCIIDSWDRALFV